MGIDFLPKIAVFLNFTTNNAAYLQYSKYCTTKIHTTGM